MQRYLLFDAGCAVCRQLAGAIEKAAGGRLEALSLRDPQARAWLERAYPNGWEHRPYLVAVDGDRVQVFSGLGMALRLGWLLGPRKAWRVWNLARQYGALRPGDVYSAERRGFLKRATLFVAGLFFFPQFGVPDRPDQARRRPRHPFEGIRIKSSRELKGAEKARAVRQALRSRDVRNVVEETGVALDAAQAIAVRHELEGGNTLLAVAVATQREALIYHELAETLVDRGARFKSQAMVLAVEEETARLLSVSVNGRPPQAGDGQAVGMETTSDPCGGCVDPIWGPWQYESVDCTSTNWQCVIERCGACSIPCSAGLTPPCITCLLAWCPYWVCCGCCNAWETVCIWCPTPP